jgi:hypothetical protein
MTICEWCNNYVTLIMQITYAETDFSPVTYKNVCLSCVLDNKGKDFLTAKKKEEEEYYYKQEKQAEEEIRKREWNKLSEEEKRELVPDQNERDWLDT